MLLHHKLFFASQNLMLDYVCRILNQADPKNLNQSLQTGLSRFKSIPKISTKYPILTNQVLNKPVVIVCNHPNIIEPVILLASLPKLKNQHLIMRSIFATRLPTLKKILLPVYITHAFFPDNNLELEEKQKNKKTIEKATKLLEKNHQIIIFPGATTDDKSWKSGIGHMLANTKNLSSIYLLPCHIANTTTFDIFRLIPLLRNLFPRPQVTIEKPVLISKITKQTDPKLLTNSLFHYYQRVFHPSPMGSNS